MTTTGRLVIRNVHRNPSPPRFPLPRRPGEGVVTWTVGLVIPQVVTPAASHADAGYLRPTVPSNHPAQVTP